MNEAKGKAKERCEGQGREVFPRLIILELSFAHFSGNGLSLCLPLPARNGQLSRASDVTTLADCPGKPTPRCLPEL